MAWRKEFKTNGDSSLSRVSRNQLFPEPNIYLISDPTVASSLLKNINILGSELPSLVVIDNDDFVRIKILLGP